MIFKYKYILFFIVVLVDSYDSVYAKGVKDETIKDMYGRPILFPINDTSGVYFCENGAKVTVSLLGVEFNRGRDALKEYLNRKYYAAPLKHNRNNHELLIYFFILLDENLEIKEVRATNGGHREAKKYYYESESILVDVLKNTKGMWHKTVENKKWYLYLHFYFAY